MPSGPSPACPAANVNDDWLVDAEADAWDWFARMNPTAI